MCCPLNRSLSESPEDTVKLDELHFFQGLEQHSVLYMLNQCMQLSSLNPDRVLQFLQTRPALHSSGELLDPGRVLLDPDIVLLDHDMVLLDLGRVLLDHDIVLLDPDRVLLDPDIVLLDHDMVLLDPDRVLLDPDIVLLDHDMVLLDLGRVLLDYDIMLRDPVRVLLDPGRVLHFPQPRQHFTVLVSYLTLIRASMPLPGFMPPSMLLLHSVWENLKFSF